MTQREPQDTIVDRANKARYRSGYRALPIAAAIVLLLAGCLTAFGQGHAARTGAPPPVVRVTDVRQIAQLIGVTPKSALAGIAATSASINDTMKWGVCGGDLGSLIYLKGAAYLTLGDNYTSCPPGTGGPGGGLAPPDWRSNAVGIIPNPADFQHGLHIARWISRDGKHAAEVIPSQHDAGGCQATMTPGCEVTKIPTYGFASQGRLFLAYMSVHNWGLPGVWQVNYSSLAMSADAGQHWTNERQRLRWGASSNFAQVAVAPDPGGSHLLFYGIPGGRFGAVKLMRVANDPQAVLSNAAYEYFSGTNLQGKPSWSKDESRAVAVAGAPVGELSVIYDAGLKLWLMTYLQGGNDQIMPSSGDLVIRTARNYWGPWSAPATLAPHDTYPGEYGAFMEPHFLGNGGRDVYFVMSRWGPYAVFWMQATLSPR